MSHPVIDRARSTFLDPDGTVAEKIALTRRVQLRMPMGEEWGNAPEVQARLADWGSEADELETTDASIRKLEDEIEQLRIHQAVVCRRWTTKKQAVLAAVDAHCDGSKDKTTKLGCDVAQRNERPLATTPEGLKGKRSKVEGRATAQWTTHGGVHNTFRVQHAQNPDDPATFSPEIFWTRGTFTLDGQTPGAIVYFRVAAVDARLPDGQTPYTSWVPVRVSA